MTTHIGPHPTVFATLENRTPTRDPPSSRWHRSRPNDGARAGHLRSGRRAATSGDVGSVGSAGPRLLVVVARIAVRTGMRALVRVRGSARVPLLAGNGPLAKVPPIAAFGVVIALFVVAIVVRGVVGAAVLGVLVMGVGVLLSATWRVLPASARAGRVLVLVVLVGVAVSMLLAK